MYDTAMTRQAEQIASLISFVKGLMGVAVLVSLVLGELFVCCKQLKSGPRRKGRSLSMSVQKFVILKRFQMHGGQ